MARKGLIQIAIFEESPRWRENARHVDMVGDCAKHMEKSKSKGPEVEASRNKKVKLHDWTAGGVRSEIE